MSDHVVGFIFARGGSKGVPRKNIRPLAGKPLLAYAIAAARASRWIDRVIVSTDDDEIAAVARRYGAETPFRRPAELASDTAAEWLSWQHALRAVEQESSRLPDVFVSIPAPAPLRSVTDVDACVATLVEGDADMVITVTEAQRSPYFNMVTIDPQRGARLVADAGERVVRRQDAPKVYDITTVAYAARPEFILNSESMFDGRVACVVIPPERALDIDSELDFQIAEFFLARTASQTALANPPYAA